MHIVRHVRCSNKHEHVQIGTLTSRSTNQRRSISRDFFSRDHVVLSNCDMASRSLACILGYIYIVVLLCMYTMLYMYTYTKAFQRDFVVFENSQFLCTITNIKPGSEIRTENPRTMD